MVYCNAGFGERDSAWLCFVAMSHTSEQYATTPQAIVVAGPTASGKTALGIELARRLGSEIISADSMQCYRGFEIGTAAPSAEERAAAIHHLVAYLEPGSRTSAGAFAQVARPIVDRLNTNGRTALVVGGSGLYINALIDGLFDGPPAQPALRERLYAQAQSAGNPALLEALREVDPVYAATLSSENDLVRIVRALEVYESTGVPFSVLHAAHQAEAKPLNARFFALDWPREILYARINARVDVMVAEGWVAEVEALLAAGHGPAIERIKALGYREIAAALRGDQTLEEAIERTKMHHRRYARRQLSWFRNDPRVHWLDCVAAGGDRVALAEAVLGGLGD